MPDDIVQFNAGDKVTAEETNANNLLLKEWALDNSASQAYIDGKIATLTSNLNSQISALNTQISNVSSVANSKISATQTKGTNGGVKFSNGIIINWGRVTGMGDQTDKTITLSIAYTTTNYSIVGGANCAQYAGDKGCSWYAYSQNKTYFKLQSRFENQSNKTVWWVTVGY